MPKLAGKTKDRITFSCDPMPFKKIQAAIGNGEFSTVTDLINTALTFYFENREKEGLGREIKEYMESPDGEVLFKYLIQRYLNSQSNQ
ncbi:MAG: hypothetical protein ABFC78_09915 [Methanoregula sp.]